MRRCLLLSIATCLIAISTWAQPRITSNKETHNFGQVEWKIPATVEYSIANSGNKPLVLTNVTASCACAVSSWTKTPIQPGEKGKIKVTFDAKALGRFNKSIAIYSNASPNLVYLYFTGEVVRKVTDFTQADEMDEDYASIGQILIDKTAIAFPDTRKGETPGFELNVVNRSDMPYEPVLMHLPPYIQMTVEPAVLQRGQKGTINLTLDSNRLTDLGLTETTVYLSRFAGDKVSEENEIPISVTLLPNNSGLTSVEKKYPPMIQLSETEIDLSKELAKKLVARRDITISNVGESRLEISKVQVFDPGVEIDLKSSVLSRGEKTRFRVSVNKKNILKDKALRLLLITNDPKNPKIVINIHTAPKKK